MSFPRLMECSSCIRSRTLTTLLDVTLPVFLVIGFGYVAVWRNLFSNDAVSAVMNFAQNFAIPCLLFRAISTLDIGQHFEWSLLASYYSGSIACFVFGIAGAMLLFKRSAEDAIVIGFTCLYANSVLLGLPVTERAFGSEALGPNYAIVAFHAPVCYLLGITSMEMVRNKGGGLLTGIIAVAKSMSHNPLMIAIALGFAVNLTGIPVHGTLTTAIDLMASAALPAALFSLGGVLVQYRPEGDAVQIGFVCLITLFVHPMIVLLMAQFTGITIAATQSAVITAAMAPGANAYIFANMYGRAKRVAASAVLIGTAISIITVSAWLAILG